MSELKNHAIILDADPGIDDAVAMSILFNKRKENIAKVVSTYGNIPLEKSTRNALILMTLFKAEHIPLVRGAEKPGSGNAVYEDASYIHGSDGLGGLHESNLLKDLTIKELKATEKNIDGDYLKILYDTIKEAGKVDYITLGPMTNLSALIKKFPDVTERIHQLVVMGGGIGLGNATKYAEFNFYCDAESTQHVMSTVKNIILAPIDITTQVNFSMEQITEIGASGTPLAKIMEYILTANYKQCVAYGEPGATMHDSTAILAYLYPELFEFKTCGIKIECGRERYGESTVTEGNNVQLMTKTNPAQLLKIISEHLK